MCSSDLSLHTHCATLLPLICSIMALTCGFCRCFWGTATCRQLKFILMLPESASKHCMRSIIQEDKQKTGFSCYPKSLSKKTISLRQCGTALNSGSRTEQKKVVPAKNSKARNWVVFRSDSVQTDRRNGEMPPNFWPLRKEHYCVSVAPYPVFACFFFYV